MTRSDAAAPAKPAGKDHDPPVEMCSGDEEQGNLSVEDASRMTSPTATRGARRSQPSYVRSLIRGSRTPAHEAAMGNEESGRDVVAAEELDLFHISQVFLESAAIIYTFCDLRELARAGKLKNPEKVLQDRPTGYMEILDTITTNRQVIEDHLGPEEYEFFEHIVDQAEKEAEVNAFNLGLPKGYRSLDDTPDKFGVVEFGDSDVSKGGGAPVYMIEVDCLNRFVGVTFRGTVTLHDARTDSKVSMAAIPNPLAEKDESQPALMYVHNGFAEYLYNSKSKSKSQGTTGSESFRNGTKCNYIIEQIREVMEANPGFALYITGHSMGAALASLFAFELACREDSATASPVTCIGIASPRVADKNFRAAFNSLERQGKLRCLNVINMFDPIPLMPNTWMFFLCSSCRIYRHVGVQLILSPTFFPPPFRFTIKYRENYNKIFHWIASLLKGVIRFFVFLFCLDVFCCLGRHNHNSKQYVKRLYQNSSALSQLTLNDVYKDRMEEKR